MGSGEPTELMSRHDPTEVTRRHVFAQEGLPKKEEQARIVELRFFGGLTIEETGESLGISIDLQLPDGGKQVTQGGDHGLPLASSAAKNPLRKEIAKLAQSLHELGRNNAEAA